MIFPHSTQKGEKNSRKGAEDAKNAKEEYFTPRTAREEETLAEARRRGVVVRKLIVFTFKILLICNIRNLKFLILKSRRSCSVIDNQNIPG